MNHESPLADGTEPNGSLDPLPEGIVVLLRVVARHQQEGMGFYQRVLLGSGGLLAALDSYEPLRHGDFTRHAEPLIEQAIVRGGGQVPPRPSHARGVAENLA